jgi:hypothetical protein
VSPVFCQLFHDAVEQVMLHGEIVQMRPFFEPRFNREVSAGTPVLFETRRGLPVYCTNR